MAFGQGHKPRFPENVKGKPAKKPDCFTDGGVKNPSNQQWAVVGFGIWHEVASVGTEEPTLHHERYVDDGVARWGPMAGFSTSSTRNELAGGILSLFIPKPVHIASDSSGFVDKANFLIKAAHIWLMTYGSSHHASRNPCGTVWGLQIDGDLWEIFWMGLLVRGPFSVRITWVKGHATQADIASGRSTHENRKGNNHADDAATWGTESHQPGMLALTRWLASRHIKYIKLMSRVQSLIVKMLIAEKEARSKMLPKDDKGKVEKPTVAVEDILRYDSTSDSIKLDLLNPPIGAHKYEGNQHLMEAVHYFLNHLK